jgi:hypothetical protein
MWAFGHPATGSVSPGSASGKREHVPDRLAPVAMNIRNSDPRHRLRLWAAAAVSLGVAIVMVVGSHVMVMRQATVAAMSTAQLVGGQPIGSFHWNDETWVVMPTTYTFNKQASLLAIARSWPVGVGPTGQPAFTGMLQDEGRFPRSIWMTTPHCTYLGAVAELGAAGLVALVLILVAAGMTIRRLLAGPAQIRWEAAAYAGAAAGFAIEAISTDLLNCRHYWLLLAVMVARLRTDAFADFRTAASRAIFVRPWSWAQGRRGNSHRASS